MFAKAKPILFIIAVCVGYDLLKKYILPASVKAQLS